MNFESQLKNMFSDAGSEINAESFLDNFHQMRKRKEMQIKRIKSGILSSAFVLILSVFTVYQLDNSASVLQKYNYELSQLGITEESQNEFDEEMALYLVNDSDDIWSTISFFYESEYQPVISIVENKL
ncbi:hypothetical protein ACFL46_04280 [Candidatus Neomarinimicrobiota bacterium]